MQINSKILMIAETQLNSVASVSFRLVELFATQPANVLY